MTTTVLNHRTAAARAASVTYHQTAKIDGVNIFYREAGPADAPVVLLLHGFPTSSHMFRNLIPALADRYHVIAPDYPGFGQSDMPDRATFAYTFDRFAELVDGLLDQLGVTRYAMYVMDYGAPVGWRLALKHTERVTGLIVQNGNAYDEGLKDSESDQGLLGRRLGRPSPGATPARFSRGDEVSVHRRRRRCQPHRARQLGSRPGAARSAGQRRHPARHLLRLSDQLAALSAVQAFFRKHRPPTLIVWGKNDKIFPADGAHAYTRDLPDAELHLLDTGHFAFEDKADEMVPLIRDFLDRKIART